jgi:CDGSH-type Zn-finger protein
MIIIIFIIRKIMDTPIIAERRPAVLTLEPGTYSWCACGRSKNQPFCDNSHLVTDITPVEFTITEKKTVTLCRCKQTKTKPYCDGSHKFL